MGRGHRPVPVYDKFTGKLIGHADRASRDQVEAAVAAAHHSFQTVKLDAQERYGILRRVCDLIEQRRARARGDDHRRSRFSDRRRAERSHARDPDVSDLGRRRQAARR